MLHKAITTPNALILIVAEKEQSEEDLRRINLLLQQYQQDIRDRYHGELTLTLATDNKTSIEFGNKARILALASMGKRGYTAPDIVWFDEAAHDVPDESFVAMEPMIEVGGGQLIISSTPNGTSGFYARELENPIYEKYTVPYTQVPHISKESVERKRMLYGEAFVEQEYNCKLLDDVTSLFTLPDLTASMDDTEDVFAEEMAKIQESFRGEVLLV
jgi:hypothetical protein